MKVKFILLGLFLAFLSCKTLEQKCSERFPSEVTEVVTETLKRDTIITPWHTVEFVDTTECLPSTDTNLVFKTIVKKLPPDTIYHETVCVDTIIVHQDQEKVNWLMANLREKEQILKASEKTSRTFMFVLIGVGAICLVLLFFLIRSIVLEE